MSAKKVVTLALGVFVGISLVVLVVKGVRRQGSIQAEPVAVETEPATTTTLVVYYLHGSYRCATCQKLEAYTSESLQQSFADEIRNGRIDFRIVNFDEPENDHLRQKYGLHSQSVVLSMQAGGKESRWKNLDRIWKLVRDKEAFLAYIRDEVRSFRDAS
jgi:MFS superfamily sulfate permease-like transporter